MKKALICGISGQDGPYLARLLLENEYEVFGTSRDAQTSTFGNLARLGIHDRIHFLSMAVNDFRSVLQVLEQVQPDELYNLAGQTSVGLSFEQPLETMESIAIGTYNLLEAIRFTKKPIKLYNACSSECFGDTGETAADESTPFHPKSPYAIAKAAAFWAVLNYCEAYDLFACSGILFNHESPLRPERFVTKKIITTACKISMGSKDKLRLGNISICRDWGWAPEYVVAMWLMLQQNRPETYVIATGETYSLEKFTETAFSYLGLDWREHTIVDSNLFRPVDIEIGSANPRKASEKLGWKANNKMKHVVKMMINAELSNGKESTPRKLLHDMRNAKITQK